MHELALAGAVLDAVARHAEGRPVRSVRMRIGALRQVVPNSLAFYFEIVGRGTLCEGAELEQELIAARLRCRACDHGWEPELPIFLCPGCGAAEVEVVAGEEFEVESIVVEEEEEGACIEPR